MTWLVTELTGSVLIDANGTPYDYEETGRIFSRHRHSWKAQNAADKLRREGHKARVRLAAPGEAHRTHRRKPVTPTPRRRGQISTAHAYDPANPTNWPARPTKAAEPAEPSN